MLAWLVIWRKAESFLLFLVTNCSLFYAMDEADHALGGDGTNDGHGAWLGL